ncbi:MAG: hypothetical protein CL607_06270 [Anaerolineaceae bacterium]|nr:hypothetical protein [Anaerolineaceae bacterium]
MTKKIFISYAKKDAREIALALADALAEVDGLEVWIDRSLRAGRSWELQIQQQIDDCDVMIVLYSPDINRHKLGQPESYVLTEIAYAKYTAKKPIIPVMAIQTDALISLTMEHYIDFTISGVISKLVEALCSELEIASDVELSELEKSAEAIRTIIGEPFEWCEIPAGEFLYGKDKETLSLPTFAISKYPITYRNFQQFIEDEGFDIDASWWNDLLWYHPSTPGEQTMKYSTNPRDNVNWYEAISFCSWLSQKIDPNYDVYDLVNYFVRLPTEPEWEKASRGIDGREYPWGNRFDAKKCNTFESGTGTTSPVTLYSEGNSPYGVQGMTGNVWEWCLNEYFYTEANVINIDFSSRSERAVRGGSWIDNQYHAYTYCRSKYAPHGRGNQLGFRIMRPL